MEAETKTTCWRCNREGQAFNVVGVGQEMEVDAGKGNRVMLRVRRLDGQRDDGKCLCKPCMDEILDQASMAIDLTCSEARP